MERAILFLVLACFQLQIAAQYPQIFFTQYNKQDGLSENLCGGIIRDKKGYVWIGTTNGLNRFDGYHFQIFRNIPGDSTSLQSNEIYTVHEDSRGDVWVAQNAIVSRWIAGSNSFEHFLHHPSDASSYSGGDGVFFTDSDGQLWISTFGHGLNLYLPEQNSFKHFCPEADSLNSKKNRMGDVAEDDENNLWIASQGGLCSFNKNTNTFQFYVYKPEDIANQSYNNLSLSVHSDQKEKNIVWYGTWGSGLHSFDKTTGEIQSFIYNLKGPVNVTNIVYDIQERDANTLWIGTEQGLGIFDKRTHQFFFYTHQAENPHSLSFNDARNILVEADQTLWVTTSNGLSIADAGMQNFALRELPSGGNSLLIDDVERNKIYGIRFYANRSLYVYEESTGTVQLFPIPKADEMKSEPFGFFQDSNGLIWIGCTKTGIYVFDPTTSRFTKLETEKQLQISDLKLNVRGFAEDSDGNIWIASFGHGMIMYDVDTKKFRRFSDDVVGHDRIPFNSCFKILDDSKGNICGLFENNGICILGKASDVINVYDFKNNKLYQSLQTFTDALFDDENNLWITTKSSGLVHFDIYPEKEPHLKYFNTTTHFPDNNLTSLVKDSNQNLWIAGSDGLIFFDTKTLSSKTYSENNGLYPYYSSITMLNARNDEIWFPMSPGYCAFRPKNFKKDKIALQIVLNSFKVYDREIYSTPMLDELQCIELRHKQNFISIEFAALCFSNPKGVQYAYMLEGLETDWNHCGTRRYASYTDLKPGEYTLKIKAANDDGVWNENPKTLLIIIHPAWWQTSFFKIGLLALAVILAVLLFRFFATMKVHKLEQAIARQKEVQDIRNRIARDIHDEIGSGLTKISVMSSKLNSQSENQNDTQQLSEKIQKTSRDVIERLGEIVWTVNPKNDSLGNLLSYIRQYAGKYFDSTSINHKVEIVWMNEEQKQIELSPEVKRNVLMIVKEALNNVVKHSEASACEISFRVDEKTIYLNVHDNGKGLPAMPNQTLGNGLKNMQKRTEEVMGNFEIDSGDNVGTRIRIVIPIGTEDK